MELPRPLRQCVDRLLEKTPLADLQREGKVRHIGLSEVSVEQIQAAREITTIASVQNLYNLTNREAEDVLSYCEANDLAFIPWFPIATGELARPGGPLDTVAKEHDATPAQLALAWLLRRSPVMLPIPGTSRVAHLEEIAQREAAALGRDNSFGAGSGRASQYSSGLGSARSPGQSFSGATRPAQTGARSPAVNQRSSVSQRPASTGSGYRSSSGSRSSAFGGVSSGGSSTRGCRAGSVPWRNAR